MTGTAGVRKIVRFNWPWYAGATLVTVAAVWLLATAPAASAWRSTGMAIAGVAGAWLLLSLLVSHVVYDRSDVARGGWLGDGPATTVGVFHFGQDEASALVARALPAAQLRTFDLYDASRSGSPSLRRARAAHEGAASGERAPLDRLPLTDGALDLAVLAFAAHEARDRSTRVALFREIARAASSGRIVVLEHLRDVWNLLAYGPGAFHFLSRRAWLDTFAAAGLVVIAERNVTPWVRRFELASGCRW